MSKKKAGPAEDTSLSAQFSLILPTLNERENIVPQIQQVLEALPDIREIWVVDDASTDQTLEAVAAAFPELIRAGRIHLLARTSHFGLTPSLREGIAHASGKYVGWMDCDLSMPPALFRDMLQKLESGYDVCLGTRFGGGGKQKNWRAAEQDSRAEILLSSLLNTCLKWTLRLPISDYTSGFVVAKKNLFYSVQLCGHHGEYFIDFMAQAQRLGAQLTEIPYECGTRKYGKSKTFGTFESSMRNCFRYFWVVLKVTCAKFSSVRAPALRQRTESHQAGA